MKVLSSVVNRKEVYRGVTDIDVGVLRTEKRWKTRALKNKADEEKGQRNQTSKSVCH